MWERISIAVDNLQEIVHSVRGRSNMIRIAVGGQVDKKKVVSLVEQHGKGQVSVKEYSDIEAAMAVKSGQADYYLGACHTGGGGALAMAIAMLGKANCATVSMPGRPPKAEEVEAAVKGGAKAFGFTADHIEQAVPMILEALLA